METVGHPHRKYDDSKSKFHPATISAATNRQVLITLIGIMRDMGAMLWALARMVIALRNKTWPELQE